MSQIYEESVLVSINDDNRDGILYDTRSSMCSSCSDPIDNLCSTGSFAS
jgi:hypothetical protein